MQQLDLKIQKVLDEHAELRDTTTDLRKFLEMPRPDVASPEATSWASGLAERLVHFHDKAFKHFREEETSGFFEELSEAFPRATRDLELLKGEHEGILDELRGVLKAAMFYAENEAPERPNMRAWTTSILDRFEHHERRETDIAQKLLCDDLGCGD